MSLSFAVFKLELSGISSCCIAVRFSGYIPRLCAELCSIHTVAHTEKWCYPEVLKLEFYWHRSLLQPWRNHYTLLHYSYICETGTILLLCLFENLRWKKCAYVLLKLKVVEIPKIVFLVAWSWPYQLVGNEHRLLPSVLQRNFKIGL